MPAIMPGRITAIAPGRIPAVAVIRIPAGVPGIIPVTGIDVDRQTGRRRFVEIQLVTFTVIIDVYIVGSGNNHLRRVMKPNDSLR
jgi:hypothetical protein